MTPEQRSGTWARFEGVDDVLDTAMNLLSGIEVYAALDGDDGAYDALCPERRAVRSLRDRIAAVSTDMAVMAEQYRPKADPS